MTRVQMGPSVIATDHADRAPSGAGPVFLRLVGGRLIAPFAGSLHPDDEGVFADHLESRGQGPLMPVLVRWLLDTGQLRFIELVVTGERNDYTVHAWDVTTRVRNQQVLEHKALHDPLTGLANRVLFEQRVSDELRRRTRTGRQVAVLYADLDGFKQVNDTWGHAAGDILLTTLADRLRDSVRPGDVVARLGGDEFAICCPELVDAEAALQVAHRVIDDVSTPVAIGSTLMRVSVAVGVALADGDEAAEAEHLIARADLAMYAAKTTGRQRVALAPPSSADVLASDSGETASGVA